MEEFLTELLSDTTGPVAYATVFGILVACGLGVPLPEDISLILGGYLAHTGSVKLIPMMVVGFLGILAGDSLIFMAGRRMGNRVEQRKGFFARIVTPEKRARVEGLFRKHGEKIVMIARFMPGVRAVTYFTAGGAGMKYSHFIFWDGLAALASAPLFVFLGFKFGGELEILIKKLKEGQIAVLGTVGGLIAAYLLYRFWKNRQIKKKAALQAPVDASVSAPTDTREPPRDSIPAK